MYLPEKSMIITNNKYKNKFLRTIEYVKIWFKNDQFLFVIEVWDEVDLECIMQQANDLSSYYDRRDPFCLSSLLQILS